ncbi:protease HtpX [Candidatus Woesearchaeota archaeon]|nr:MAG: protease HtpX [Candidatus Woesearchaeota archaeon]
MKNQLKTLILLSVLTALLLWIGSFWGRAGLIFGLIFALIINFGSYFFSDKIILTIYRAKEVKEKDNPKLYRLVKEVVHLAKLPMPKLYIIPTASPNAFATGRNPKHSAVAVTEGILNLLTENELKGVIAHELGHIKNRDILIQTIAATIAGVISYIATVARWSAIFGGFGNDRNNNFLELIVLAILAPIIALIIQLAISRSREYLADETSARTLHNSHYLISALEKLEHGSKLKPLRFGTEATSSLFIINPFKGSSLVHLFSTHPSTKDRIKRLKELNI